MKKLYLNYLLVIFLFSGCAIFGNRMNQKKLQEEYPYTYEVVKQDQTLQYDLLDYLNKLNRPKKIKNSADVLKILAIRDSLVIPPLHKQMTKQYAGHQVPEPLHQELKEMGIFVVTAQNNYVEIGPAPVITEKVEQLTSDEHKLYQQFNQYHMRTKGKAYPYLDLENEMNLLVVGALLKESFPQSDQYSRVKTVYEKTLIDFADIHRLEGVDVETYLVGDVHMEYWPYVTELKERNELVKKYPDLEFIQAIQNIASRPSALNATDENIYLVVVDWFTQRAEADRKRLNYISSGVDVPHVLRVKRLDNSEKYALVYRFHYKENRIKEFYDLAKEGLLDLEIIKVTGLKQPVLKELSYMRK